MSTRTKLNQSTQSTLDFSSPGISQVFYSAVANYLDLVRQRAYGLHNELSFATNANLYPQSDQDYFHLAYNKLYSMGGKIEAYCLLRLAFGNLRTDQLLSLLNSNRLLTESKLRRGDPHA